LKTPDVGAPDAGIAALQSAMVRSLDGDTAMAAEPSMQARLHVLATLGIPSVLLEMARRGVDAQERAPQGRGAGGSRRRRRLLRKPTP
jgi:hypothetical protein